MKHAEILVQATGRNDLQPRAYGEFYTPPLIAKVLIETLLDSRRFAQVESVRIIDPFCGDGRLLVRFIHQACEQKLGLDKPWSIAFWDYDYRAVKTAEDTISHAVKQAGIKATIEASCHDSFLSAHPHYGQYDWVITNPPWKTIKPDQREMQGMTPQYRYKYRAALREYDQKLAEVLPHSQPKHKFAGWGTNLSRCGTELAINLTSDRGLCGIVLPMSLLTDQVSVDLRRWIFSMSTPLAAAYYPAETKLFRGVDQEVATITLVKKPSTAFTVAVSRFDRNLKPAVVAPLSISSNQLSTLEYCLPIQFGETLLNLAAKWEHFEKVEQLEVNHDNPLWMGRELDETRYQEFLADRGAYPFIKGKMVGRYNLIGHPAGYVREDLRQIPQSVQHYRIAWRDVSRRNQARRMQAAIIPPGVVTGNSLHVAHFQTNDMPKLRALLVIMNSLPFEFQVRAQLGTGHVSLGVIRKIRIPSLDDEGLIYKLTTALDAFEAGIPNSDILLELLVAQAYGIGQADYRQLLGYFEELTDDQVEQLKHHWPGQSGDEEPLV